MTQRTSTEIAAELAEFRAARAALLKGERVESVSRDGRAMRTSTVTLESLNNAIRELEREYAQAVNVEAGGGRRAAIGVVY